MLNFKPFFSICHCKKLLGDPRTGKCGSAVSCGLSSLGHSLPGVQFEGAAPPIVPAIYSSEKFDFGWVNMRGYKFFVSRPKCTNFC